MRTFVIAGTLAPLVLLTFLATSANATSFKWSYTFESGEVASGTLKGDISQLSPNIINVTEILGTYSGDPEARYTVLRPLFSTVSISGGFMSLVAYDGVIFSDTAMSFGTGSDSSADIVSQGVDLERDIPFNPEAWTITEENPVIPEPSTIMLFGAGMLGLFAAARYRKKPSADI